MSDKLPAPLSDLEIVELAYDILGGRVLNLEQVPPDLVSSVFLPVFLGAFTDWSAEELSQVTVFGVIGKDNPTGQAINGYPMLFSCRVVLTTCYRNAMEKVKAAREAMQTEAGPA